MEETNSQTTAGQLNRIPVRRQGAAERKFDSSYFESDLDEAEVFAPFLESDMEEMSAATRKRTATVGGDRFPMPDAKHAKLALEFLPRAKNLSPEQRDKIKARAHAILSGKEKAGEETKESFFGHRGRHGVRGGSEKGEGGGAVAGMMGVGGATMPVMYKK